MCKISGCSVGRPFIVNIFLTAFGLDARAASPYTVSVGIATSESLFNARTAVSIANESAPFNMFDSLVLTEKP